MNYEYPISAEDFDKYASDKPVVNSVTCKEDGYRLYGDSLSANVKFKMYDNGDIAIVIMKPEEVLCYTCDIKFKTRTHEDSCPICGKEIKSIIDINRRFQDEWNDFEYEQTKIRTDILIEEQPKMMLKYGLLKEENVEDYKATLRASNK